MLRGTASAAENLPKAGDGGLHRSRGGFMLVMHGDGVLTRGRHVRDAAGASDGRQRQPRSHVEIWCSSSQPRSLDACHCWRW